MRMGVVDKIKNYLEIPLGPDSKAELEALFTEDMYPAYLKMGGVIMVFEAIMILSTFLRGGPGPGLRYMIYFYLYVALFSITGIYLLTVTYLHRKKPNSVTFQINFSIGYTVLLCVWSCFLTLLDQYSGPNLNVYSYILMATSVFCMLRPWQSILLFSGNFLLLIGLATALQNNTIFFKAPLSTFNLIINGLFVTVLTIVISVMLFRYRIMKKHDRTVINAINQQLNDLAMTDQLTGVGNRRYLEEKMQLLQGSQSSRSGKVAGMILDIDFFKQYNDNFGHQAGDACLKQLAAIMQDFIQREHGFVVRYGGEEFFLCLPDGADALKKAEALRLAIVENCLARNDLSCGCVTVSIGVDTEDNLSAIGQDEFLRRCDMALYQAKNTGRNKVCIFESPMA